VWTVGVAFAVRVSGIGPERVTEIEFGLEMESGW
jgi:hypothetical protein